MKNPMTPSGIEPATFRFVAQHLNYCATAVPTKGTYVTVFFDTWLRLWHSEIWQHTVWQRGTNVLEKPVPSYSLVERYKCLGETCSLLQSGREVQMSWRNPFPPTVWQRGTNVLEKPVPSYSLVERYKCLGETCSLRLQGRSKKKVIKKTTCTS